MGTELIVLCNMPENCPCKCQNSVAIVVYKDSKDNPSTARVCKYIKPCDYQQTLELHQVASKGGK